MTQDDPTYDVIVIGSGPSGREASAELAKNRFSVALIEAELVGGDCAYWACVPSKALLRPPEALNEAKHIEGAAEAVGSNPVDINSVFARRDKSVDNWDDTNMQRALEKQGIRVIHAYGELAGEKRVIVKPTAKGEKGSPYTLTARHAVVLSTGSSTWFPETAGLVDSNPWNSRDVTGAHEAPSSLAILGMGPVACEMATAMSSLGTREITIIGRDDRLLSRYEPFVGERLAEAFLKRGIKVLTNRDVRKVSRVKNRPRPFEIWLDDGSRVTTDQLLVAAGRQPNSNTLGLESVGLRSGQWLDVDDTFLVKGVEGGWLYAIGDLNRRALLTHVGKYQGRICAAAIASRAEAPDESVGLVAKSDHDAVPQVVFTDPEVAAVGLTEKQARDRELDISVVDCEMDGIPGAGLHTDGYSGHARIIVDEKNGVMIGATFIGPQVGDLIHAATVAIVGQVPMERLWHAIPCFPTVNEVWLDLLENYRPETG